MGKAQIHRHGHDVDAERRGAFEPLGQRRQRRLSAAPAAGLEALDPRDHRPDGGQVDLVVARRQHAVGRVERRPAVRAAGRTRGDGLVGALAQQPAPALAAQAALARAAAHRLVRPVRLAARSRWRARIVRRLRRPQPRFQLAHARRQRLHLRPQSADQCVLLGMRQGAEVRKLGHTQLQPSRTGSRQCRSHPNHKPPSSQGMSIYVPCRLSAGYRSTCLVFRAVTWGLQSLRHHCTMVIARFRRYHALLAPAVLSPAR